MTSTFGIRSGSFRELRAKVWLNLGLTYALVLFGLSYINTDGLRTGWASWLPVAGMLSVMMIGSGIYAMRRQARLFESMELTVSNDGVVRTQHNTPTKKLAATEIIAIEHYANGPFIIKGIRATDHVWMPAQVEHPEALAQALGRFGSVVERPAQAWYRAYASLLGLLVLPLLYFCYTSSSKIVTAGTGALLLVGLSYSFWEIQRSKDIDNRVKLVRWAMLPMLLSLVLALVVKLSK